MKGTFVYKNCVFFFIACFCQLVGCSTDDTDGDLLRMGFPSGKYMVRFSDQHSEEGWFQKSSEEQWSLVSQPKPRLFGMVKRPGTLSFKLEKKTYDLQLLLLSGRDVHYNSELPETLTEKGYRDVAPRPGVEFTLPLVNNFPVIPQEKYLNINVIKSIDEDMDAVRRRFVIRYDVLNYLPNFLPERRVKLGDSWNVSVIKPLNSLTEISTPSGGINAVVTFEKSEVRETDHAKIATLGIKIHSQEEKLCFLRLRDLTYGLNFEFTYKDAILSLEGEMVLDITNGTLVSYMHKGNLHGIEGEADYESDYEFSEEYKCEFIFTPHVPQ